MPAGKQQIQHKEHVSSNVINFSNVLMKSPLRYTLMERRFLYKLASLIRERFNLMGLDVRKNWDNLFFEVSNKDLAEIGGENSGKNNVIHTYNIICKLADRTIVQYCLNKKGELEIGRFHWINSFVWNADTNCYTVEVSSQLYDYVCCMTSRFTHFNLRTGIIL